MGKKKSDDQIDPRQQIKERVHVRLVGSFPPGDRPIHDQTRKPLAGAYSTVTDLARLRGWSTSQPRRTATW